MVVEWQIRMAQALSSDVMRDIANDARRSSRPGTVIDGTDAKPKPKAEGPKGDAVTPLCPPEGISIIDQLCDEQDRRDRAALMETIARSEAARRKANDTP